MKDDNQQIDFSSQPLGLMAQEGSEIEKRVMNEENAGQSKSNFQAQDNPFAQTFTQVNNNQITNNGNQLVNGNRFINTSFQAQATNPPIQNVSINQTDSANMNQIPNSTPVNNMKKVTESSNVEEVGSWGIFVFLFLVLIVAGAAFLFKSGKIDELLGDKEDTEVTNSENTQVEQQEENTGEQEITVEVKNFQYKETFYIASGSTITFTATGVVDMESRTSKYSINMNMVGVTSSNVTEYCDYINNICYSEVYKSNNEWMKEDIYTKYLGPVEVYNYITSLGESKDLGNGNYRISMSGDLIKNLVNDNDQVTVSDFSNKTVTVDYLVENGYLKRVKYDVSSVVKNVDQCIIAQEFTNINSNDSVTIPEDVIKLAQ